jgi:transcriptional regulator with XRE-family HTH domain
MKDRIKEVRKLSKLSQTDFGKAIGVSLSSVQKWESGENTPTAQVQYVICDKFGINPEWLETGEGERLKLQESSSLIPRLQRIFSSYPTIAHTLETALAVMKDEDFQRLTEIIEECKKNARG